MLKINQAHLLAFGSDRGTCTWTTVWRMTQSTMVVLGYRSDRCLTHRLLQSSNHTYVPHHLQ